MTASARLLEHDDRPREDHFVHLHEVSWDDYEKILEIRGDHSAPRINYLKGELEIMSPSRDHESLKGAIGRLVEVFCLERDVEFTTVGSWTLKERREESGAEPDECYLFGKAQDRPRPDLAIEVVWTSGGINKLEIYRRLGVREVWYWRRGRIEVHLLRVDRYEQVERSEVLPGIDVDELASFLDRPSTSDAIRAYRAALRAVRQPSEV